MSIKKYIRPKQPADNFYLCLKVFLNTQMPSIVDESSMKSSNLNFEDDDEVLFTLTFYLNFTNIDLLLIKFQTFLNISNSLIDFETSLPRKDEHENSLSVEQNKNHCDLDNDVSIIVIVIS